LTKLVKSSKKTELVKPEITLEVEAVGLELIEEDSGDAEEDKKDAKLS
jgi:hypothetical protein